MCLSRRMCFYSNRGFVLKCLKSFFKNLLCHSNSGNSFKSFLYFVLVANNWFLNSHVASRRWTAFGCLGSGCGAVASNTRDRRFESSHRQYYLLSSVQKCIETMTIKKKRPGMAQFLRCRYGIGTGMFLNRYLTRMWFCRDEGPSWRLWVWILIDIRHIVIMPWCCTQTSHSIKWTIIDIYNEWNRYGPSLRTFLLPVC